MRISDWSSDVCSSDLRGCGRDMKRIPPDGATARSRSLRANMTDAERKVWALLRSAFPKWCFRRQVPFHHYIADFASHRARLVLEIYGGRHGEASDAPRTAHKIDRAKWRGKGGT